MNKTKIDWCDMSWNPVTGCLHDCQYCYARNIAKRFGGEWNQSKGYNELIETGSLHDIGYQLRFETKEGDIRKAPYPYGFDPTFHKYRLDELTKIKKPQNIFVCSMADLFGDWVSDEWIDKVFKACEQAPQHRYLFLTKNPKRFEEVEYIIETNYWYGVTITNNDDRDKIWYLPFKVNKFFSVEPICEKINFRKDSGDLYYADWIILGAETGNRKEKIMPKREWIEDIVNVCKQCNMPVFMKSSLRDVWGDDLIQEKPF